MTLPEFRPDRVHELALLRALLADERCQGDERTAFENMQTWLGSALRGHLSAKQRAWVESVASRLEIDEGPMDFSKVPRGNEVKPAWNVVQLPKRPPGKRI